MSSISSINKTAFDTTTGGTSSTTPTTTDNGTPIVSGPQVLGQADFLQLLSVQFQNQDPMQPMDDTAFIAQMAQFSSLQQTQTLTQQMTQLAASQSLTTANSYIGRKVTVDAGKNDGTTVTGNVTAVDASTATPQLIINGQSYPITAVLRLEPGDTTTTPAT
jgi:flagellar basal-body rod modification protein FlgD